MNREEILSHVDHTLLKPEARVKTAWEQSCFAGFWW